jgi:hypothetical protein
MLLLFNLVALVFLNPHDDKLPCQKIEHAPENECHERTAQNDDVVRHTEVGRREVDQ